MGPTMVPADPSARALRRRLVLGAMLLLAGALLSMLLLEGRADPVIPTRLDQAPAPRPGAPVYDRDIRPLLERRCVVCHGCYDAPCQLKLGSWEGLARGLSKAAVYDHLRLKDAPTTRLGIDAQRASQWRERGFSPVLDEHDPAAGRALSDSLLWQVLALKESGPLPEGPVLDGDEFDFSLDRDNVCPRRDEFDEHARRHPRAGMPYGLPALSAPERQTIARWLQAGAPAEPEPALPEALARQVRTWEDFLNGAAIRPDSPQARRRLLVGRYLYEHLFLGHLVFEGDAQRQNFRLVRSGTPPGEPVRILPTRRPYDDPGVARPWYRLVPDRETVLAKTHMPYVLSPARLARWTRWFVDEPFAVDALPDYRPETASNPFRTFVALPMASRYRFLLDDAGFFVMNFIKGPVCRGPVALDVIRDRFWVFFVDPALGADDDAAQAVAREGEVMRLPAAEGPDASLLAWRDVARAEDRLLATKTQALSERFGGPHRITADFVWRGEGGNRNAALTVMRHFDSATVVQGLVGEPPRTAWVIGYPLLERIFYLLVAGYDVYGNTAHQLQTRLAMDFLRMEGEANFLMLMPRAARQPLRDDWYRGVGDEVRQRILGGPYRFDAETGIAFPPGVDPKLHLFGLLQRRLEGAGALEHRMDLGAAQVPDAAERQGLQRLAAVRGASLQWWPEAVVLRIDAPAQPPGAAQRYYSVLRNTAHRNVSTLLREKAMLVPEENTLTVVPGVLGAYPNALLRLRADELPALAATLAGLRSEADYRALADRWAVRRTSARFWAESDALMDAYARTDPDEAGLLDWSRLENR